MLAETQLPISPHRSSDAIAKAPKVCVVFFFFFGGGGGGGAVFVFFFFAGGVRIYCFL